MLCLDGLATVAEVYLERRAGARAASRCSPPTSSTSASCSPATTSWRSAAARSAPLLAVRRSPGRAGARRSSPSGNLRFFRTMLLGRAPGFAPGPAVVGPWRPVALRAAQRRSCSSSSTCAPRLEGDDGVLECERRCAAAAVARRRALELDAARADGDAERELPSGAATACGTELADPERRARGGRTPTATPALYELGDRRDAASEPCTRRPRRLPHAARPAPTWSATASACASTACRCSPAARCGRRST